MRWQDLFFTLLSMPFGTLFGASNEPKTRFRDLGQSIIIKYCAPDGCSESFLGPPGDHFGHFGAPFLVDFGCPGEHFGHFGGPFLFDVGCRL